MTGPFDRDQDAYIADLIAWVRGARGAMAARAIQQMSDDLFELEDKIAKLMAWCEEQESSGSRTGPHYAALVRSVLEG